MYKLSLLCVLLAAILFNCVLAHDHQARASTVGLHVFEATSEWWVAVQPRGDDGKTEKVEFKDSISNNYITLAPNSNWGYFSSSANGVAFSGPFTFRLTSSSGAVIIANVASLTPGAVLDTRASYSGSSSPSTPAPAATTRPTSAPSTPAATTRPTSAPSTPAATTRPTNAPSTPAATERPVVTSAPTSEPTSAPTTKPTSAPTTKPTSAPTSAPVTAKPTNAPTTSAPTTKPTFPPNNDLCSVTSVKAEPLQILVPLYVYPGAAWDALIAASSKVKIIAIINPNNGPVSSVDSAYSTYMTKLKNAGIEMVGYVYTSYGSRSLSLVKADVDLYVSKYPLVKGIFLDEAANEASKVSHYTQIYNHIMSKPGYAHSILNPGVQPDQGYLAISTNIMILEDYASTVPSKSYNSYVKCAANSAQKAGYKYKFSGIVHTASSSSQASYLRSMANMGIGLVYVTDGAGGCCTYNKLTTYFAAMAQSVADINNS